MRRMLFWVGVLVAVLTLAGGVLVAARGVTASQSPAAVVRSYFAALGHGDAPRALAYGRVPFGPHTLLTDTVLREQQRIAALRDVIVVRTQRHGNRATVDVTYTLGYPGDDVAVRATVPLHEQSGSWRLDYVAVPTQLEPDGAAQRESLLGGTVPTQTVLLFPGALPIRFDTAYLGLDPSEDNVGFDDASSIGIEVKVTDAGRRAMLDAVRAGLRRCLTRASDPSCPLPNERYVPGSIRGTLEGGLRATRVTTGVDPVGTLQLTATAAVTGTWRRLDFHNRQVRGHGTLYLDVHASAYAVSPLRVRWDAA